MRFFMAVLALPSILLAQETILGLDSFPGTFLSEGRTNLESHPAAIGTVRAIMLFAKFPDGTEDLTPRELYEHLVPQAINHFKENSNGKLNLEVDADYRWWPIAKPSTDESYNYRKFETHRAYVAEIVSTADLEIDFSKYAIVYVVANHAKGWAISPTLNCDKDHAILADGNKIRHAVTFGNDSRGKNWGWQTLVHETGHIFGLPDLYNHIPIKRTSQNVHLFVGSWDPMGHQGTGADFLAWHKYKLAWLGDKDFTVVKSGKAIVELDGTNKGSGVKACVLPLSRSEAYVLEVRSRSPSSPAGVLIYRVSTKAPSGRGAIQIMSAKPDEASDDPELPRKYMTLYNALYFSPSKFEDKESGISVDIQSKTESGYKIEVSR